MEQTPRHQCLLYDGAPSRLLHALAAVARDKLAQNFRCFYLNSVPMVAGMRSYLAAAGVDVERAMANGSLILNSEQTHLVDGHFHIDRMMQTLADSLRQALSDGHRGLWATGDMTWEMGPDKDFAKLLEYEWRLEQFFQDHPEITGVCQYHAKTLPREVMRQGLLVHPAVFINETLSMVNPHYVRPEAFTDKTARNRSLDSALVRLCQP